MATAEDTGQHGQSWNALHHGLGDREPGKMTVRIESENEHVQHAHQTEDAKSPVSVEAIKTESKRKETARDANKIDWDGDDDPQNPRNWSVWSRGVVIGTVMAIVFTTSLATSAIAPAIAQLLDEFHSDNELAATLVVTIELMGTAVAPLLLAPLSEIYGRNLIYHISNVTFCLFTMGCALAPTLGALVVLRFFQGCSASGFINNVGGIIADLVPTHRRGTVMSLFSLGFLFGPVLGPIIGSYSTAAAGWRWIFWLLLIMSGVLTILFTITCRETYEPVLLARKAKRMREEMGNPDFYARNERKLPASFLFAQAIVRPFRMLLLCPPITSLSLYIAFAYGLTHLLFSTFSLVFQGQYHCTPDNLGLTYLGLATGMMVSLSMASMMCDRVYMKLSKKYGKEKPEYRLESLIYGAIAIPIGFCIYGWTVEKRVNSVVPIVATAFHGFGVMFTFIPIQLYMIDAYPQYATSALAASSVLRSIARALIPLAGVPMYDALGYGWGNTTLRKYHESWNFDPPEGFLQLIYIDHILVYTSYVMHILTATAGISKHLLD